MRSHTRHVTLPMETSSRYGDSAPIIDGEEGMCGRCMNPAAPPGAPSAGELRPWPAPYPFAETGRCTERVSTRPPCPGATEELCVQYPKAGACGNWGKALGGGEGGRGSRAAEPCVVHIDAIGCPTVEYITGAASPPKPGANAPWPTTGVDPLTVKKAGDAAELARPAAFSVSAVGGWKGRTPAMPARNPLRIVYQDSALKRCDPRTRQRAASPGLPC